MTGKEVLSAGESWAGGLGWGAGSVAAKAATVLPQGSLAGKGLCWCAVLP